MKRFIKDPNAILDYKFDWTSWLGSSETITVAVVTAETGLTITLQQITDSGKTVTFWLSGGLVRTEPYTVTCHITTSQARQDDRSMRFTLEER